MNGLRLALSPPRPLRIRSTSHRQRDRGASAVEVAILAPGLLLLIAFAVMVMRIEIAGESVDASAHDAARAASISRNASDARTAGNRAATNTLQNDGLRCLPQVHVDVSQFARPIGQPASVTAVVTCRVKLSDIAIPGLPGTKTMTSTFTSPIDQYGRRS